MPDDIGGIVVTVTDINEELNTATINVEIIDESGKITNEVDIDVQVGTGYVIPTEK